MQKSLMKLVMSGLATLMLISTNAKAEEVHLFRGAGDVFSLGVENIAKKLNARGVKTRVYSHTSWKSVAANIRARAKKRQVSFPIVVGGHSMGGVGAANLANALGAMNIPVKLVVGIDPGFIQPAALRRGTKLALNYMVSSGKPFRRGPGFSGKIKNYNVSKLGVSHTNIDDNPKLQSIIVRHIRRAARG